jgi:hypothetical protein
VGGTGKLMTTWTVQAARQTLGAPRPRPPGRRYQHCWLLACRDELPLPLPRA